MSEIDDLVERLREPIIADAFGDGRIASGLLSETLINERAQAADMIGGWPGVPRQPRPMP